MLLLLVLFGALVAFFATQNTGGVTINFNEWQLLNVPLYLVVLGSMLLGIMVAWVISLVNGVSTSLTLFKKDRALDETNKSLADYKGKIHDLEVENERLRAQNAHVPLSTKLEEHLPSITH